MSEAQKPGSGAFEGTHTGSPAGEVAPVGSDAAVPALDQADDDRLDGLLPLPIQSPLRQGPGRPKGSKNRRTDLVAAYLVERFGDPLTASMATAGMPLVDLARELRKVASDVGLKLGASVMDIARFQRDCRNDALPYIHAKRAPETAKGDPVLPVIGIGTFSQTNVQVNSGGMSLEEALAKRQQNQQVIDNEPEVSHGEKSHDDGSY